MSDVIKPAMIMTLRKRTGVGMSKCKEALIEADGDMEEAVHILRKKGIASAVKKGGRETKEGVIGIGENRQGSVALIEVSSETDFVLQNEQLQEFLATIAREAAEGSPKSIEDLLQMPCSGRDGLTVDQYRIEIVHSLGENIQINRVLSLAKKPKTSRGIYSHMGGKIVSIVDLSEEGFEELAKEIAMHVAAESPEFLNPEEVPEEVKEKEKEIARTQLKNKPEHMIDKILEGKLESFYAQHCLVKQKYVKDPSVVVADFIGEYGKKKGAPTLEIAAFVRWQVGE